MTTTPAAPAQVPTIVDCEVDYVTNEHYTGFDVTPVWSGVDRPRTGGWVVGTAKLAERLARAVRDGAVHYDIELGVVVDGQTYPKARSRVMAKYANADLRRLGY